MEMQTLDPVVVPRTADPATRFGSCGIEARFVDEANQEAAEALNASAAELLGDLDSLRRQRDESLGRAWDLSLRDLMDAGALFRANRRTLEASVKEQLETRIAFLPLLVPGCETAVKEAEAELEGTLDDLEQIFRSEGIDEYSLPSGDLACTNPAAARTQFRRRLMDEPIARQAIAVLNRAKETRAVLKSMLPIQATPNAVATYFRWPIIDATLPAFVSNLFV